MTKVLSNVEELLLNEISTEVPNDILEKFSTLVRVSGSEGERKAFDYLKSYLNDWGVSYTDHNPEIYLSIPKEARLKITSPLNKEYRVKTVSFSESTDGNWQDNELIYVPSDYSVDRNKLNSGVIHVDEEKVKNKVILTEGLPMPAKVKQLSEIGVSAAIFISPGERIHEGTCTSIWGSPDLDTFNEEPNIAVLTINKSDGEELIDLCKREKVGLRYQTTLDKDWFHCPLIDIFIEGNEEPENFLLLHGHLDSWHVGIGDNATGNAAILEMVRIFHNNRDKLKRSLRVAIWPGHSTGRYAGSTWFADNFALELEEKCIAQVNCDSPGCRWATSYKKMRWMSESEDLCKKSIKDAIGVESAATRPTRAGDYSFNNIGISSFYMLSSVIPDSLLEDKEYYPVGGCGSNIEWHTEDDLLYVADLDILVKDIKVYMTTILRVLNSTVYPFNFVTKTEEIINTINKYQEEAGRHFDFSSLLEEAKLLREKMVGFYESIDADQSIDSPEIKKINDTIRKLARELVLIDYSTKGKFKHDLALDMEPLPDIANATELKQYNSDEHYYKVLQTHLTRGQNRVMWALRKAMELVN